MLLSFDFPLLQKKDDDWEFGRYTADVLLWGNIIPCHYFAKEMKRRYVFPRIIRHSAKNVTKWVSVYLPVFG